MLIVHFRKKIRPEHAGVIPGDIEAVKGGAGSDAYVVIRHKPKQNGDAVESDDVKH